MLEFIWIATKVLMLLALIPVVGLVWILLVSHIDNYFFGGRGQDWLDTYNRHKDTYGE